MPTFGSLLPARIGTSPGTTTNVSSFAQLTAALGSVTNGSIINITTNLDNAGAQYTVSRSGVAGAPITITCNPGVLITNTYLYVTGSYLRFLNLDLGSSSTDGIRFTDAASFCEVDHCHVHDSTHQGISIQPGAGTPSAIQIWNCEIHDNGSVADTDHGISWNHGDATSVIGNCVVYHNYAYNIQLYPSASNIIVTCCTLDDNFAASAQPRGGIITGSNAGNTDNVVLAGVISTNAAASNYGFHIYDPAVGDTNNNAYDCLGFANGSGDFEAGGGFTYTHCIHADPIYVNRGARNYHLSASSPAINVIPSNRYGYVPPLDRDGFTRATADAGSYAYLGATTMYASPNGNDANSGLTASAPKTLRGADNACSGGGTVILLPGTYNITGQYDLNISGGGVGSEIVWQGNGSALLQYTGSSAAAMLKCNACHNRIFNGLTLDGLVGSNYYGTTGVSIGGGSHHITVSNCTIRNMGAAGIAATALSTTGGIDYLTAINNFISHCGYNPATSWSSGISFNNQAAQANFDAGTGFHNIIAYNIISGCVDTSTHHSDGNGIILDGHAPNTLIIGNVCYMNGGRGIELLDCDSTQAPNGIWIVNNTCYKNTLDKKLSSWPGYGEFVVASSSASCTFVNNAATAWTSNYQYQFLGTNANSATGQTWASNYGTGGNGTNQLPAAITGTASKYLATGDMAFAAPPVVDSTADGQYATAPSSTTVTTAFLGLNSSPLLDAGVDPSTIGSPNANQLAQLATYDSRDLLGTVRPSTGSGGTPIIDIRASAFTSLPASGYPNSGTSVPPIPNFCIYQNGDVSLVADARFGKAFRIHIHQNSTWAASSHNPFFGAQVPNSGELQYDRTLVLNEPARWYAQSIKIASGHSTLPSRGQGWGLFSQLGYPAIISPPVGFAIESDGIGIDRDGGAASSSGGTVKVRQNFIPLSTAYDNWIDVVCGVLWRQDNTGWVIWEARKQGDPWPGSPQYQATNTPTAQYPSSSGQWTSQGISEKGGGYVGWFSGAAAVGFEVYWDLRGLSIHATQADAEASLA